jgi:hypothetical protein
MTDENTVFDAAFEYQMNGMSEESARVAASEDETKDARIAALEAALSATDKALRVYGAKPDFYRAASHQAQEALKAKP